MNAIPLANHNHGRLHGPSFDATVEELDKAVMRDPGLLKAAQVRATAAWQAARRRGEMAAAVDAIWNDVKYRSSDRSLSDAAKLKIALETEAVLNDLASMVAEHYCPIIPRFGELTHGGFAATPEARALLESRAGTARWLKQLDAKLAAQNEAQRKESERYQREDAPRIFLNCVRARGILPELDGDGNIVVPPDSPVHKLVPSELRSFVDWKEPIAAILAAERAAEVAVEAATPRVLA